MAERRRLREVLLSVFMIAIYVCWLWLLFFGLDSSGRLDAGVKMDGGDEAGSFWRASKKIQIFVL
jgi:hypothetical protein